MAKTTLNILKQRHSDGRHLAFLTCYDATTARIFSQTDLDGLLVGDTAAQMLLGYNNTIPATPELMLMLTQAVRRNAPDAFLIADMPYGMSALPEKATELAIQFMQQADADCVKIEVELSHVSLVRNMSQNAIPVAAHIGCRPQQVKQKGYTRQNNKHINDLCDTACAMAEAGASMLLLESATQEATSALVDTMAQQHPDLLIIGCGAGKGCSGSVIVSHDLLGLSDWQPPFAQPQVNLSNIICDTTQKWIDGLQ